MASKASKVLPPAGTSLDFCGATAFAGLSRVRRVEPRNTSPLEEPPARALILLISHAPGRLLPTIRSRCRLLALPPLSDADVDSLLEFYRAGRKDKDFDLGIEMALARVLASPQFIYRIEEEPAARKEQHYNTRQRELAAS